LVFFVALILFICLTILGVKFFFDIGGVFRLCGNSAIIGPIVAVTVAALIGFLGVTAVFGLSPIQLVVAIIIVYTVVRQVQDYFITPYVMGKITQLHPLIILFAVIAGGHTAGMVGLILAVPVAGVAKNYF